ncbi:MAG: hypothetical protein JNK72_19090 [Myxococcales bacterium]|nr:hypothetical protein [Myxococcales bacterium]
MRDITQARPGVRFFAAAAVCLAALAGCSGNSVVGGPVDAGTDLGRDLGVDTGDDVQSVDTPDAASRCTRNEDCAGNPADQRVCDTGSGRCVGCVASNDTCPVDQYCNPMNNTCVAGCRSDDGCRAINATDAGAPDGGVLPGQRCNVATRTCVTCVTDEHCPSGNRCVGNQCVPGCAGDGRCPTGLSCCEGACVDRQNNTAHCGACGTVCMTANAAPACASGSCAVGNCTAPYGDCDSMAGNGCETDLSNTLTHCGACGNSCPARANAAATCAAGTCGFACNEGFADCDGDAMNGCEVELGTSARHCGACNNACVTPNATAACARGACAVGTCDTGFGDCDTMAATGCETDLRSSVAHCGACGTACPAPANGAAVCADGACGLGACNAGFANCDGMAANGCEANIQTSAQHCGGCGMACAPANAAGTCMGGVCAVAQCNAGFADCDNNPANGCEVDTRVSLGHCGACGTVCPTPSNGSAVCRAGVCGVGTCGAGFGDCDGNAANGCETQLGTDVANCGACMNRCATPANGAPVCANGSCGLGTCSADFANCDGNAANGCETNTTNTVSACGACGNACSFANAAATCIAGACGLGTCNAGFANCDGNAANGCETNLTNTVSACGACGNVCSFANATPACAGGACTLATCNDGFRSCDNDPRNGCEVDLRSDARNCGACGNVCASGSICVAGTCQFGGGGEGPLTTSGTTTINVAAASAAGTAGTNALVISNQVGTFRAGQAVIVHQTQGAGAGTYEFNRLLTATGSAFVLASPLVNSFATGGANRAQIVAVPEYTTVTVAAGTTLTAPGWNGNTGGILAFDASGAVTVNGTVSMSALGFRGRGHGCTTGNLYRCARGYQGEGNLGLGGVEIAANGTGGGGGGAGQDDGAGGGGGHGAAGATGDTTGAYCGVCAESCPVPPGRGGAAIGAANLSTALFMGGAGGEGGADEDGGRPGRGGNGGGVIFIRASSITVGTAASVVSAGENGQAGDNAACGGTGCGMGTGGGGAGGAIRLVSLAPASISTGRVVATGGSGAPSTCSRGRSGDGAVGRIGILAPSTSGTSTPTFNAN